MLPRRPAAVIFDMDGLLFDTEALYQKAIMAAAAEAGHEAASDVFERTVGRTWDQSRSLLLDHFGAEFAVDEFFAQTKQQLGEPHGSSIVTTTDILDRFVVAFVPVTARLGDCT